MSKKFTIFLIGLLTTFLGFLIVNNVYNTNIKNVTYENFLNKTIEIKEELLKENSVVTKSIEGKLFIKDSEKLLKNIELVLYKETNGVYEKSVIAYTDESGNYKFNNLEVGNYKIKLETDEDYKIINEDAIITVEEDILTKNIDIEVQETDVFKAQITKYVKQIRLIQDSTESVYDYDKQNKVVIPLKNIKNLSGTVEYEFEITNVKSKEGFVKVIKDKLPDGLSFNQEKNPSWKEKNGYLYTTQLSNTILKINETKKVSLILDINDTNEGRAYLNKVSITGEIYHKVTFINLGDIFSELNVLDGDTTIEEVTPMLFGFRFTGWYKDEANTELFDFSEPITEDVQIYAGWQKEINVKYMVDEAIYSEETIYEGEKTNKPVDPSKEGYIFDNWYKDENYTELFDFDQELTSDTVIYGKLNQNIINYNVTYVIEGKEYEKVILQSGTKVEDKIAPEKASEELSTKVASYQFDGWYEDESYSQKYDFDEGISKDLTLYGKYVETLLCKTTSNIKIPTKEEITNSITYEINKVDLDESNANIITNEDDGAHVIIDGFEAVYYDSTNSSYKIVAYTNSVLPDTLVIPDTILGKPVVQINGAFKNLTINNIKISSTLEDISSESFNNSVFEENVDFSEAISLKNISSSFQNIEFKTIDLGNSINLTSISTSFTNSNGENFLFNNTINLVDISAVLSGSTLNLIDLGNSINLTSLNSGAFKNLTVNNISFSNTISLTTLYEGAFSQSKITNLDFGNSVNLSSIKSGTFDFLNLEELNMSKLFSLSNIEYGAFQPSNYQYDSVVKKLILGTGVKNIGIEAFKSLEIEEVDMECTKDTLESIEAGAFNNNNLTDVSIVGFSSLKTFDFSAYSENSLTVLKLKDLPSLSEFKYLRSPITFASDNEGMIFDNIGIVDLDITRASGNTGMKQIVIQNNPNLVSISENTVTDESYIDKIVIKNNPELIEIGDDAFWNVAAKKIILEELPKLKTIGEYAFHGSNGLEEILIEDLPSLEYIGFRAFSSYKGAVECSDHNITLKNLPNLKTIDQEAFMRTNIKEINLINLPNLTTIYNGAFSFNDAENIILTGDNLPSLTTIGLNAFYNNELSRKKIIVKDLPYLTGILMDGFGMRGYSNYHDSIEIENLPLIESLTNDDSNFTDYVKELSIKNCEKLDLSSTFMFNSIISDSSSKISSLTLENLPSTTKLSDRMFYGHNITELDLVKLGNLQSIGVQTFAGVPLEIIKLPETLTTIGNYAFSSLDSSANSTVKCIEIQGDSSRFNDVWTTIGLPETLTPSTCAFTSNTESTLTNISANVLNESVDNITETTYNIVLYKMDDGSLISNDKTYKLQKLTSEKFSDITVLEDIENVGRYQLSNESNDKIKSFNNKIYLTNITQGTYKLIDESEKESTLTFIVESNGEITGNAKISLVSNNDKVMSSSEAEFITTIQTGNVKSNYLLILLVAIILSLNVLIISKKKLVK